MNALYDIPCMMTHSILPLWSYWRLIIIDSLSTLFYYRPKINLTHTTCMMNSPNSHDYFSVAIYHLTVFWTTYNYYSKQSKHTYAID